MWEKHGSQVMAKMFSANQITVFFNHYLINGVTCDSDFFLPVDKHE